MIDYWNGLATPVWDPRPKLRRGDQRVSPNRKSDANLYDSGDAQRGSPKPGGWVPAGVTGKLRKLGPLSRKLTPPKLPPKL